MPNRVIIGFANSMFEHRGPVFDPRNKQAASKKENSTTKYQKPVPISNRLSTPAARYRLRRPPFSNFVSASAKDARGGRVPCVPGCAPTRTSPAARSQSACREISHLVGLTARTVAGISKRLSENVPQSNARARDSRTLNTDAEIGNVPAEFWRQRHQSLLLRQLNAASRYPVGTTYCEYHSR